MGLPAAAGWWHIDEREARSSCSLCSCCSASRAAAIASRRLHRRTEGVRVDAARPATARSGKPTEAMVAQLGVRDLTCAGAARAGDAGARGAAGAHRIDEQADALVRGRAHGRADQGGRGLRREPRVRREVDARARRARPDRHRRAPRGSFARRAGRAPTPRARGRAAADRASSATSAGIASGEPVLPSATATLRSRTSRGTRRSAVRRDELAQLVRALAGERDEIRQRVLDGARREQRIGGLAGARVERADLLADVAAEHPGPDRGAQLARDHAVMLDRQVRDAAARVEHVGVDERAGRARVEARAAAAAARLRRRCGRGRRRARRRRAARRARRSCRAPGAISIVFFATNPRPAALGPLALEHRRGVDARPARDRATEPGGERGRRARRARRASRGDSPRRARSGRSGRAAAIRGDRIGRGRTRARRRSARAPRASRARRSPRGADVLGRGEVRHLAGVARGEPARVQRVAARRLDRHHRDPRKAELARERGDVGMSVSHAELVSARLARCRARPRRSRLGGTFAVVVGGWPAK